MTDQELRDLVAQNAVSIANVSKDIAEMRKSHEQDFAEMRKSQDEMNKRMEDRDKKADRRMKKLEEMR